MKSKYKSLEGIENIISIRDFSKEQIVDVINLSAELEGVRDKRLDGQNMAALFFEPSTRTRLSFESAMLQLGGRCLGFADAMVSSTKKGETLYDTIRVLTQYVDIIVIRHPLEGSARLACEASSVPVINGGDGANQHPTQTFLDLYTIWKSHPQFLKGDKICVAMLGDLRYGRTIHSLLIALSFFNVSFKFISPPSLKLPENYINLLKDRGISYEEMEQIPDDMQDVDVLYATRIQEERFPDPIEYMRVKGAYRITSNNLSEVKKGFRIMHPLPRVNEIDRSVDEMDVTAYFTQAGNGIPVRKALLSLLLGKV